MYLAIIFFPMPNCSQTYFHSAPIDIVQRLMKVFAVSADNLLNDNENSVVELQNHRTERATVCLLTSSMMMGEKRPD